MEDTVVLDSSQEPEAQQGSLKGRLLYKKKFEKYVRTTTTHGVKQIFIGKSKIRRLFWTILFLTSLTGCLYGIISSIILFSEIPTATTVYTDHVSTLTFPAITICNLNGYRLSVLNKKNLTEFITASMLKIRQNQDGAQRCEAAISNFNTRETLSNVIQQTGQPLRDLIVDCSFLGNPCDMETLFTSYSIPTGTCYTFNGGNLTREYLSVNGSGFRHSLQLVLNVHHDRYVGSPQDEAGVLISIHEQGTPALTWESGVAVPVGHSAFLSVTRNQIKDKTYRSDLISDCINNPESFKYVQNYNYSYRACRLECILSQIADDCGCAPKFETVFGDTKKFRECTISDMCCIFNIIDKSSECPCPVLCDHASFDVIPSYSTFPATSKSIAKYNFTSLDDALNNLLQVRVFFGGLSIHREITVRSYTLTELTSNIGGSLGLFLGASILSVTEFLTLIFDVIKDRLCGLREKRIKDLWSSYKHKKDSNSTEMNVGGYSVYIDSMDSSPTSSTDIAINTVKPLS